MQKKFLKMFLLVLVCFTLVGCGKKQDTKEEKSKETKLTSKDITKEQTVSGISISEVEMKVVDGMTTFNATATNTTEKDIDVETIKIIVQDEKGKEIVTLTGYIGSLKTKESKKIINSTDIDLSKAKSIKYEI